MPRFGFLCLYSAFGVAIVFRVLTGVLVAASPVMIEFSMLFVGLGLGTSGFPLIMAIVGVVVLAVIAGAVILTRGGGGGGDDDEFD